ncbi:hypothetical protein DPMN_028980 [Dreissena polymorpha]|uniref:Uncharacterized protein n=1 Tax=Dreissena polymorpha TaxID=45954 RepID=A0A9D4RFU3_DREPO|nr:hypothetical protein DPMN_028980 [Dreissena polymorpha]
MVRRRRRMWSWQHIKLHRDSKLRYKEAYVRKLEAKRVPADLQKTLDVSGNSINFINLSMTFNQFYFTKVLGVIRCGGHIQSGN